MRALTLTLHPAIDRVVEVGDLVPGATFDGRLTLSVPSGKGVNTARSLGSVWSDGNIAAAAWIGRSEAAWYAERLREISGVRALLCSRDCPTRLAHTLLEKSGRETHIKEAMRSPSRAEQSALLRFVRKTVRAGDLVALCGSTPAGTSPSTLKRVFALCQAARGATVIADTNGVALDAAGASGLHGIKGNAAEIGAWLGLGRALNPQLTSDRNALRKSFMRRGAPRSIMVTLSAKGALLATAREVAFASPPPLPKSMARSATGCGDAATAGWLWALADGCNFSDTLARAVACGTAKLASADPGFVDAKLVRRLLSKTRVTTTVG